MRRVLLAVSVFVTGGLVLALSAAPRVHAQTESQAAKPGKLPSIAEKTTGMQKLDGFFPMYWDDAAGALYLEIPHLDSEFLYQTGLGAGHGIERHRPRSRPARRHAHRQLRARGHEGADGAAELRLPRDQRRTPTRSAPWTTRSRSR